MKKKCLHLALYISLSTLLILLTACHNDNAATQPYDSQLADYLQTEMGSYYGDNHYYHAVTDVVDEEGHSTFTQTLSGEVLNTDVGASTGDYDFVQTFTVDSEKISMSYEGQRLNETDYDYEVILKSPIVLDATWSFKANRPPYKQLRVDAKIIAVTEDQVTVTYSDAKGYQEVRVLTLGKGVTDFYKYYQYQDAKGVTGYHFNEEDVAVAPEADPVLEAFNDTVGIDIPQDIHALILAYNLAWEDFINEGDQRIFDYLTLDAPARESLTQVASAESQGKIDFISFIPTRIEEGEAKTMIYLDEAFYNGLGQAIVNHMIYTVVKTEDSPLIYTFEVEGQ